MLTTGERLRMARERKGLSQLEVYKLTNISNKSLSRYENDIAPPSSEVIKTLVKLYDVSTDFILGFSDEMCQIYPLSADDIEILKKLESLSPELKEKATDYLEMLKMLQKFKSSNSTIDFKEKA
ncbi:helix-turn-helix domain-containing protein [Lacrimispora sp. JR3]|uniref:helix-turn-helix domain-containing protein n=1 Tax=Lacrimispora sinapis TaxID=3111456 RepID=UPI003749A6FE